MEESASGPLTAGLRDGDFELETLLGRGGMGEVWRARQLSLQRPVALKFVAGLAGRSELRERLSQEARSAARIVHQNAVKVFGVTSFLGRSAVIMEEVRGSTLRERLASGEGFSLERVLSVAQQAGRALAAAEREGVVHRDIKPGNLMLDDEGHLTVLDFGLARLLSDPSITRTGVVMGTMQYMSPEQATGRTADIRSDLYSLGIVLFELLAGFPPYRASGPAGLARAHLEEEVPRLTDSRIPGPLSDLVARLMDKDPARRPPTAAALVRELDTVRLACLTHPSFHEPSFRSRRSELEFLETATGTLASAARPHPGRWRIAAGILAMAAALLGGILWWKKPAPTLEPVAVDPVMRRTRAKPEEDPVRDRPSTVEEGLPESDVRESLALLRALVAMGDVEGARSELARLAPHRTHAGVVTDFNRILDEIVLHRRSVQAFLTRDCLEEIPPRLAAWAALAPDDPLLKAYRDRLHLEIGRQAPASAATREELEASEATLGPWTFYVRLLSSERGDKGSKSWMPPLLHRAEKRLAASLAAAITEASRGAGPAGAGPLREHLDRLRDLHALGWSWSRFQVDPVSWGREGRVFTARLDLKASGSWEQDPSPRSLECRITLDINLDDLGLSEAPVSRVEWNP